MYKGFFKDNWQIVTAGTVLVLVLAVFLSWHKFTSPQTVFGDMIANNLTARSVTKNQIVTSSSQASVERVTIQFGPDYAARALVTVKNEAGGVTTETLATPHAAYLRYANITDAANKLDYNSLVGVWAKAGNDSTGSQLKSAYNKSILDLSTAPVPPVGYVDGAKRAELLGFISDEKIFTPDYGSVKGEVINGRQVFTYTVTVRLAPYLRLMQEFAAVYGLNDLQSINPNDYQSATLKLNISADKLSHQMVRVTSSQLGLNETFTDYGIIHNLRPPTKTVSVGELQSRLKSIK